MRNTTRPMPVTRELRLALDAWNRANQRARSEYTTHPTVSGGYCEWCWHTSKVSPCRVCGKEESA